MLDLSNPPEFKGGICRGCYALGTACGDCERCTWELAKLHAANALVPGSVQWVQAVKSYAGGDNEKITLCNLLLAKNTASIALKHRIVALETQVKQVTSLLSYGRGELQKLHRALMSAADIMKEDEEPNVTTTKEA